MKGECGMSEKTRTRRTKDDIVKEIDRKIEFHKEAISKLEMRKERVLNPKPRKARTGFKSIIDKAKKSGMTVEEVASKLGIEL